MSLQFATTPCSIGHLSVEHHILLLRLCFVANVPILMPGGVLRAADDRRSTGTPRVQRFVAARRIVLTNIAETLIILVSSMICVMRSQFALGRAAPR